MIYRISKWAEVEEAKLRFKGLNITDIPVFVQTDEKLDIDKLIEQGIAVKEIDYELPEYDLYGNKIKVVELKAEGNDK